MTEGRWWTCPSCATPVPFSYQLAESFDDSGKAQFDPAHALDPGREEGLTACWVNVVRCPGPECERAWVVALYPAEKSLFEVEPA